MRNSDLFVLDKQYTFYKAYHTNSVNKMIHVIFTPLLIISALVMFAEISLPPPLFDLSKVFILAYIGYCIILDVVVGLIFSIFLVSLYFASQYFRLYVGPVNSLPLAFILHMISWMAQIIGHMAFEKKSPAFTSSVVQAFTAGPISTYLDSLFAFGLFPKKKAKLARARVAAMARKATATSK